MAANVGKNQVFRVGATSTENSQTLLSGADMGLADVQVNRSTATRVVPGGGNAVRRQSLGLSDNTVTFTVDYNATTGPLFLGHNGSTRYFTRGPDGSASGKPKESGGGIFNYELTGSYNDAMVFNCTIEIDGAITDSTY